MCVFQDTWENFNIKLAIESSDAEEAILRLMY